MPPATQPVPVQLFDNLVSTLQAINGGASYFHAVKSVTVGKDPAEIADVPALNIGDVGQAGIMDSPDDRRYQTLFYDTYRWTVPIFGAIDDDGDAARSLMRLAHDVHRALKADHQRGGLAQDTIWRGWTKALPPDENDVRAWIEMTVEIRFRHKDTDMTVGG